MGACIAALARELDAALVLTASRRGGWSIERRPDVLIDVSHRSAMVDVITYCEREAVPLVSATSNLDPTDEESLVRLAQRVAVVRAANLSLGHYLQTQALAAIGRQLASRTDALEVRVLDRHPRRKLDRPSETAKRLAALWTEHGESPTIEALRYGLSVSDHSIGWTLDGEELILEHRVVDRIAAARGAWAAARWIVDRPAGLFGMNDVYG